MRRCRFPRAAGVLLLLLCATPAWADGGDVFEEEPRYVLERIELRGNESTEDDVIMREVALEVGSVLNEDRVMEARHKLRSLGYFKGVTFQLERGSKPGHVVLVIEVEERNTVLVDRLALGTSRSTDFFGGLGVVDVNFLGKGLTLGGVAVVARRQQGMELRFQDPSVLDSRFSAGLNVYAHNGREVGLGTRDPNEMVEDRCMGRNDDLRIKEALEYRRAGGRLGVGWRVGTFDRVGVAYRFEGMEANLRCQDIDSGGSTSVLPSQDIIIGKKSYLSALSFSFSRDSRDALFMPERGFLLELNIELGTDLLGSDYSYSKYMARTEVNLPALFDQTLRLRARLGLVQGQTPFFNKFFHADTAYFTLDKDSLPRVLELNFSEVSDSIRYDNFVFSAGPEYAFPLAWRGAVVYRAEFYVAADVTLTRTIDESGGGGGLRRNEENTFPLSFDLGLRLDTSFGVFTVSTARLLDLFL